VKNKFKPGDIIVSNETNKLVYLILGVSPIGNYFAIILNHFVPRWIGTMDILGGNSTKYFTDLKDVDLKNVL